MSFTDDLKKGVNPYRDMAHEVLRYLLTFVKNPMEAIKQLPNWDWPVLLLFYSACAAASGLIAGLVSLKISNVLTGLIIFPISATIGCAILSGFFYYTFIYFFKKRIELRLLFTIVALSMLPFFATNTLISLLEPIKLLGLAATGALLIIGLSENTHIERKKIFKLIVTIYALYFVFWIFNMISFRSETEKYKNLATPESYEKLKEEFND